jgi:hypothetical protein
MDRVVNFFDILMKRIRGGISESKITKATMYKLNSNALAI